MADTQETQETHETEDTAAERQAPPATVFALVDLFVNQAYMGLGAMKDPKTEQPIVDLAYAKHSIDMLELLQQKTHGNLSAPEKNYMDNMLYQLRMTFVRIKEHPPTAEPDDSEATSEAAEESATEQAPSEEPASDESPPPEPEEPAADGGDTKEDDV